jgi:SOS-response transcriptional repressor LexA
LVSQLERGVKSPHSLSIGNFGKYITGLGVTIDQFEAATGLRITSVSVSRLATSGHVQLIPLVTSVGAGPGFEDGDQIGEVAIPLTWTGQHVAFQVEGDSMEPEVSHGDTVIVRSESNVSLGDSVVAYCPDEGLILKRFEIANNETFELVLESNNRNYASVFLDEDCRILGKVVEIRRSVG